MGDTQKYQELRNMTVPGLFLDRVRATPDEVAYRAKKLGIYRERTWLEFHRAVARCAMGFASLGLKHGDRVALMGGPSEEYTICELAAQALGAITYGIYLASSSHALHHVMKDGMACAFVAGNQEYLDRILPLSDGLSALKHLIVIDTRGMFGYDHPSLVGYEKLSEDGGGQLALTPQAFEDMVKRVQPSDGLSIIYTSGATGQAKGVLITHGKHLAATQALIDRYPVLLESLHRTVVYLPLCTLIGKMVALTLPLLAPLIPHYGEDVENPGQTFFEVAPTVLLTVPNYLKRFASNILIDIENSSPLKRLAYAIAVSVGRQHLHNVWEKKDEVLSRLAYLVCYYAVFRPILNKIGFNKLRMALSTGAPLPAELMALWQIYGLNLSEGYGLAEMGAGIVSTQGSSFPKPGDVGRPLACLEVMLSDTGEVLVRGEELFECYWNNQELTDEFRDLKGWLRTEDTGEWTTGGGLRLLDRVSDSIRLADGKTITLTAIESALKASPYINEAVAIGKERAFLSSLIEIDFEAVSDWASRNNISFAGFTNLIQHPAVIAHIGREIERINADLKPHEQVQAFRIIPEELTPVEDGALVTPTRKIRRDVLHKKFGALIESMYERK
ncbi:MAG TPA: AMP-binding protein [Syntrophorhabdales bacterium]|nr:AMP-binding protein [Syntrophorhabdales bacterium]